MISFFSLPQQAHRAGIVQFFAFHGCYWMILEELDETPANTLFTRTFQCSGRKAAFKINDLTGLHKPSWWLCEDRQITCLPWEKNKGSWADQLPTRVKQPTLVCCKKTRKTQVSTTIVAAKSKNQETNKFAYSLCKNLKNTSFLPQKELANL